MMYTRLKKEFSWLIREHNKQPGHYMQWSGCFSKSPHCVSVLTSEQLWIYYMILLVTLPLSDEIKIIL